MIKNFRKSIVCGKFYPPHMGHHALIDKAVNASEEVIVLICWRADETIPLEVRVKCLQEEHPTVKIISIPCIPEDNDSVGWGKYTLDVLGFIPDAVFSSEDYGELYAKSMGATHIMVDHDRKMFPISGTIIRENPLKYFDYLSPTMRSYYAVRIVIVGAESTGTTTLAKALSKYYNTVCVPEYGRTYAEWKYSKPGRKWFIDEFKHIAEEQNKLEDLYARNANRVLICDTDSFATAVWCWRYCNNIPESLLNIGRNRNQFYILTMDDIPFVQDDENLRDGEHIRHEMMKKFNNMLLQYDKIMIDVKRSHEERMDSAIKFIDNILENSWVK